MSQNKQKYLVCISNTPSLTLLFTDALRKKREGALPAAQKLTANHVIVIPASYANNVPVMPRPLLKVLLLVD